MVSILQRHTLYRSGSVRDPGVVGLSRRRDPRRLFARAVLATVAAGGALTLAGCGGDGGTDVTPSPTRLERVSLKTDSVTVGTTLDPPLGVRVVSSLGDAVEGVPVRFALLSGPGQVPTGLAVSDAHGVAEGTFDANSDLGESVIRVDIPSASQVAPLEFKVLTVPAGQVHVSAAAGDAQSAEVGTQLALPFTLAAATPSGSPAGGVRIVWEIHRGPSGGRLTSDTTFTGTDGHTQNLLTLGGTVGDYSVQAYATGGVKTDTATFTARAVTALQSTARVDSVRPAPLRPGQDATLYGIGFGTVTSAVDVRVEGASAQVLAVEPGRVRFQVPAFADRCLPSRQVGVRALVSGQPTNGELVLLTPSGTQLDLAPGQSTTLSGQGALGCLQLPASDSGSSYLVVAGNADQSAEGMTPLRLILRTPPTSGDTATAAGDVRVHSAVSREPTGRSDPYGPAIRIRESALDELARRRISGSGLSLRRSEEPRFAAAPAPGDTLTLSFAVNPDLTVSCDATADPVHAVVRSVKPHVIVAQDTAAPGGGFDQATIDRLASEFEDVDYPTDVEYFGQPADLDGNGRIILLLTPRVNGLTPRGSSVVEGGFFLPLDLVDKGDAQGGGLKGPDGETCPASNEGEVLYMPVPDPGGVYSDPNRTDQILRSDRNTMPHELQHLISAEQRLVVEGGDFNSVEDVWLGEGLSHIAEEVVGLKEMQRQAGQDIGWDAILGDPRTLDLFNTFELDDFARLEFYMLQPGEAPTLATTDPGGVRSLQMRGFAWALLRWLADRVGPSGEAAFFRDLAKGGPNLERGIANIEQATGRRWDDILAQFSVSLALDDQAPSGADAAYQLSTWDLPSIFQGLHDNPTSGSRFPLAYPLAVTSLGFETAAVDFEVRSSTSVYFELAADGAQPALAFHLTSQGGGPPSVSTSPQIVVVRLR
ncbi:MAG: IPT/TIG domain-containing protein [Candidatus Palauibacterales bacterium]|nr:IPT/TIG domain-containing protein [Candidatus Palauibacterales bacterium]